MKAGIAIDKWKLPIFERHLKHAGYQFETHAGLTADTLLLTVVTVRTATELGAVCKSANDEAARSKMQ